MIDTKTITKQAASIRQRHGDRGRSHWVFKTRQASARVVVAAHTDPSNLIPALETEAATALAWRQELLDSNAK